MDKDIQVVIDRISKLKAHMIDMYEATDDEERKRMLCTMQKLVYSVSKSRKVAINSKQYTGYEGDVLRLRDIELDLDHVPPTAGFKDWLRKEIKSGNLKLALQHVHARQTIHQWTEFDLPWIWSCKDLFKIEPQHKTHRIKGYLDLY